MKLKAKHIAVVRGHADRVGETSKFRYTCPKGHVHIKDLNSERLAQRYVLGEVGLKAFAVGWAKEHGGVSFDCPKCSKSTKGETS